MISEKFKHISIKGRVSYGISCLEKTLIKYECSLEKWKWILEKLWNYTCVEYLDDWYYEIAEYLPDSILADSKYKSDEFEYINEERFYKCFSLYKEESNYVINQIFRLIFEIGTIDLYSKLENYAPNSIEKLEKINSIMAKNNIELPPMSLFIKYNYSKNNGWGESFEGRQYSIVLQKIYNGKKEWDYG